jgi:hypothetical protein
MFRALQRLSSGGLNCIMHHLVYHSLLAAMQHTVWKSTSWGDNVIYILQNKKKQASYIYDSTYAWRDNILTAAVSLALPSYGSHYSGVSRVA